MLDAAEGPAEGGLVAEAREQCDLYQGLIGSRQQLPGVLDPKLDQSLMDGDAETQPEASPEMTCGKRARRGELL